VQRGKSLRTDRKNDKSLALPFFLPGFLETIRISSSLEVTIDDMDVKESVIEVWDVVPSPK
jgi:hypothetical protein